jgi:hypothetical protein
LLSQGIQDQIPCFLAMRAKNHGNDIKSNKLSFSAIGGRADSDRESIFGSNRGPDVMSVLRSKTKFFIKYKISITESCLTI